MRQCIVVKIKLNFHNLLSIGNLNIQPTAVPVQKAKFQTKIVKGELACQKVSYNRQKLDKSCFEKV